MLDLDAAAEALTITLPHLTGHDHAARRFARRRDAGGVGAEALHRRLSHDQSRLDVPPGGETLLERQDLPCVGPPDTALTLVFKRHILLDQPGDYALRLIVTPASGREIAGVQQDVKVYHTIEVGGKGTRSGD